MYIQSAWHTASMADNSAVKTTFPLFVPRHLWKVVFNQNIFVILFWFESVFSWIERKAGMCFPQWRNALNSNIVLVSQLFLNYWDFSGKRGGGPQPTRRWDLTTHVIFILYFFYLFCLSFVSLSIIVRNFKRKSGAVDLDLVSKVIEGVKNGTATCSVAKKYGILRGVLRSRMKSSKAPNADKVVT